MTEDLIAKNMASSIKLPAVRKRKGKAWSSEEARQFLESARSERDALYAAYVLILVLGLRKGEALGLTWDNVDLDNGELSIGRQLQRVSRQLLHRKTKTATSDATLPLPDVCAAALRLRKVEEAHARELAGSAWQGGKLIFTTRWAPRLSPATSTAHGMPAARKPGSARSQCTTGGAPAGPCWSIWMSTRGRSCRSFARANRGNDGDLCPSLAQGDPSCAEAVGR